MQNNILVCISIILSDFTFLNCVSHVPFKVISDEIHDLNETVGRLVIM
ncbi:hypothetical protein [Candidatus Blochmannia ocreatus (nom. nud.)]|uniref:Uncharacterized protein n=1 Tax=Candidatus Blochmannia ocreatus (nom. nud.) TaxID=251538 RepID=A0ABY4SX78_9ENTR|nr:hypothetical protein [Candidatus Blochmannia ocreatus]URJ24873.1 hypothetical protein M9405_01745 [Candidatus Blochmannia ocreatus]